MSNLDSSIYVNEDRTLYHWGHIDDLSCQRTEAEHWDESYPNMIVGSQAWALGIGISVFSVALLIVIWIMSCNNKSQYQQIGEERSRIKRCWSLTSFLLLVPTGLGAAAGLATIYYPQSPIINLCSDEVDWLDSLKSLLSGDSSVHTTLHTIVSVYNPNKYDAYVFNTVGTIKTIDGFEIGSMSMPDLIVPSSSVIDAKTNTTLMIEDQWEGLELMAEYYRGTLALIFRVEMEVGVGSSLGTGWMRWTKVPIVWTSGVIHVTSEGIEFEGNIPYQGDRHLCKC
mmetsp:Transcript_2783/g.3805  ORF Transcript_2783/g.3805 Transcript_2783/m.3805 type:complete len:283 (-) Transcript_2783:2515-3363(-)